MKNIIKTTLLALALTAPMAVNAAGASASTGNTTQYSNAKSRRAQRRQAQFAPKLNTLSPDVLKLIAGYLNEKDHTALGTASNGIHSQLDAEKFALDNTRGRGHIERCRTHKFEALSKELFTALSDRNAEAVARLVSIDHSLLSTTNDLDDTPLHGACLNRSSTIAKALIDAGADVNATSFDGFTPLIIAAKNGHMNIAKALILAGANLNAMTESGKTPLYWASVYNHHDMVCLLLLHGADTNPPGAAPLDVGVKQSIETLIRTFPSMPAWRKKLGYLKVLSALVKEHAAEHLNQPALHKLLCSGAGLAIGAGTVYCLANAVYDPISLSTFNYAAGFVGACTTATVGTMAINWITSDGLNRRRSLQVAYANTVLAGATITASLIARGYFTNPEA